jgi:hypothetical protein
VADSKELDITARQPQPLLQSPANRQPSKLRKTLAGRPRKPARLVLLIAVLASAESPLALARSWSYHYHARVESPAPSPSPTALAPPRLSTAQLLKQTIVSDLAIYVAQPSLSGPPDTGQIAYITGRLSLFDRMDTPDALEVLAGLSGYYLGAPAEQLYDCLCLRKGLALKPYLEQLLRSGNPECLRRFGSAFQTPSPALDEHAFCPNDQQLTDHLTKLIGEIDAAKPCSDSDFAALSGAP